MAVPESRSSSPSSRPPGRPSTTSRSRRHHRLGGRAVAVVGRIADRFDEADAWSHVAGLAIGQDISDRRLQFAAGGQFSPRQVPPRFGPVGPWLVTPDELDNPDDLALGCSVNGEQMQDVAPAISSSASRGWFRVVRDPAAAAGDVIFTGTPGGVASPASHLRFLQAGDVLETWIEGIGTIRNRVVEGR